MMSPQFTQELDAKYDRLKKSLETKNRGLAWRLEQLENLKRMLTENNDAINQAMWNDFHKGPFECSATEQGIVLSEIDYISTHLESWMKPQTVSTPIYNQLGSSKILHDAFGLTLIIGAWNYPINLLLAPFVGALAGGNAVILKPSEISAQTGRLVAQLIPKYLDNDLIAVIEGGPEETDLLLNKKFDFIFFTGSTAVGKIVAQKAAANLTPTVLELGGKSPALVLSDADIKVTARRITWGKFMNAGQTCVAPDYVLVHPSVKAELVSGIKKYIQEFYGQDIEKNADYCRIINDKNFDRLAGLLEGAKILSGGQANKPTRFIEPTLLDVNVESKVMKDEIFGPLLPIVEMSDISQMISFVNSRPKPLALYVFGHDQDQINQVLQNTSSGGISVNDVIMHMAAPSLPFGGVGASGMGHYHGRYSFETFTHAKSVLQKSTMIDVPIRYAPYTPSKLKWMKLLFK